ncbi:MAG TPA: hypothetical protein VGB54_12595 [Allosphingosinicella sp.]|jgi:hypothetical protein
MIRIMLGAAVAAVAMLLLGFLFHMTPLAGAGAGNIGTAEAMQVQSSLALNLRETGTYRVPDPNTAEQTGLYAQGPVATIVYNVEGEAQSNMGAMRYAYALFLNFLIALAIGAALAGLERHVTTFGMRARAAALFAFAASGFMHLSRPIWLHHDWGNALFGFVADGLALSAAGLIVAWFTPRLRERPPAEAPADAPREV